ncbi:hypothetical protein BT96DRAFT_1002128 [Gymnopus androsaceus JB14]|uniref:Uncharacterized protein n=1 Tax=Gymnopus androsaceus JB14 TaxID=1447944 RepID=A0A6A4GYR1_9AGAR|nr:hypothetical protein BT96DRAFT_1002128 [Gymnopus androsaceus JB14]
MAHHGQPSSQPPSPNIFKAYVHPLEYSGPPPLEDKVVQLATSPFEPFSLGLQPEYASATSAAQHAAETGTVVATATGGSSTSTSSSKSNSAETVIARSYMTALASVIGFVVFGAYLVIQREYLAGRFQTGLKAAIRSRSEEIKQGYSALVGGPEEGTTAMLSSNPFLQVYPLATCFRTSLGKLSWIPHDFYCAKSQTVQNKNHIRVDLLPLIPSHPIPSHG